MALHVPVLLQSVLAGLVMRQDGVYIDATFGRGGHSCAILEQLTAQGRLIAFDQDPEAIVFGRQFTDPRFTLVHTRFSQLQRLAERFGLQGNIDGILLDIGVSSPQLDDAQRGFSFRHDGPLDMRMDPSRGETVAAWLARVDEITLANILYRYGQERYSRRIAHAILQYGRKTTIRTTRQLADIIARAHPHWQKQKHPATRSFQALRIFINDELNELHQCLEQSQHVLKPGGRLVVICFHSLEERLIKQWLRAPAIPRHLPITQQALSQLTPKWRAVGKAMRADKTDRAANRRCRSAVLRVIEKIA